MFRVQDEFNIAKIAPALPLIDVNLRGSPVGANRRWWLEVVAADYRRDRYLSHLVDSALGQRAADIMANLPSAEVDYSLHLYWVSRLTEIQAEVALRHGAYPAGWEKIMRDVEWPSSSGPTGTRPLEIQLRSPQKPYLVKYGQRQFLEPVLRDGRVRIFPASRYGDPSLNAAIRDNELSATIDAGAFGLLGFGGLRGVRAAYWPWRTKMTKRVESNYYVYCTSSELAPRLFVDFHADACLLIHDRRAFIERLHSSMQERISGYGFVERQVAYYDPMNVNEAQIDVLSWKHFRYAYQCEMRLAWVPPTPIDMLPELDLELGSLEDVAEIILWSLKD